VCEPGLLPAGTSYDLFRGRAQAKAIEEDAPVTHKDIHIKVSSTERVVPCRVGLMHNTLLTRALVTDTR